MIVAYLTFKKEFIWEIYPHSKKDDGFYYDKKWKKFRYNEIWFIDEKIIDIMELL